MHPRSLSLCAFLVSCSSAEDSRLAPPAPGEGFQMGVELTVPAGEEVNKCFVRRLAAPEGFNPVGRVESEQTALMHHMSIMALVLSGVTIEHGVYDCKDLYTAHPELMEQGVYLYGSQTERQQIELPPGVAAFVPGGIDIMYEVHYVNATRQDIDVYSRVNAYTRPEGEATKSIWGYIVRDAQIELAPQSTQTEWTRCVMNEPVDVLFLASHTHRRGKRVTIAKFDGTTTSDIVYENLDWHRPLLQPYTEAPLHLEAGQGLELRCEMENADANIVRYGSNAEDEMCQFTMVFTPGNQSAKCEIVAEGTEP